MDWTILGEKIRIFRKKNKFTQQELADILQISRSTLSYYERGEIEPNIYTLLKLSSLMKCSIDDLLSIKTEDDLTLNNIKDFIEKLILENNEILHKKLDSIEKILLKDNRNLKEEFSEEISVDFLRYKCNNNEIYRKIPLISEVSLDKNCYSCEAIEYYIDIPKYKLSDDCNYYIFKINDNSMNRIFNKNELILVKQSDYMYNDDIVVAIIDNKTTVKKIDFIDKYVALIPQSDDPSYKVKKYLPEDINLKGVVLGKIYGHIAF